jgi:hypothetical protein
VIGTMPLYHFHIREDGRLIPDDEGQEFADAASARRQAVAAGAAIAHDAFVAGSADCVVIDVIQKDARVLKISITLDVEESAK